MLDALARVFRRENKSIQPIEPSKKNETAKLIASIRSAERFDAKSALPTFRSSLTSTFGISGNDLSQIALLDLGNREAAILVTDAMLGQHRHMSLRANAISAGYTLVAENRSSIALITEVNKAISNTVKDDRKVSDVSPLVNEILRDAVSKYSSESTDIHIVRRDPTGMILFRLHGRLQRYRRFDAETCDQISGYLYTHMAEKKTRSENVYNESHNWMDCVIRHSVDGRVYKLRYQFIAAADGWDVIIRVLLVESHNAQKKTFLSLGYAPSHEKQLSLAVRKSIGLIIVTGPTGSGKSTTQKVMMELDPLRAYKKRYTIENPVEYKIYGVTQISVPGDRDFDVVLRVILRADPDDIMVGEVRDKKTADLLADAVLTGHKLYATTHTTSATGTVLRLSRLGIERYILADRQFIAILLYQRLLPVLCPDCKVPAIEVMDRNELTAFSNKFGIDINSLYCSGGAFKDYETGHDENCCETCQGLGITEQTVAAEVITPDQHYRELIAEGKDHLAELYYRKSRKTDFDDPDMTGKTAMEHAIFKASLGLIDPRDIESAFEPFETYEIVEIDQK